MITRSDASCSCRCDSGFNFEVCRRKGQNKSRLSLKQEYHYPWRRRKTKVVRRRATCFQRTIPTSGIFLALALSLWVFRIFPPTTKPSSQGFAASWTQPLPANIKTIHIRSSRAAKTPTVNGIIYSQRRPIIHSLQNGIAHSESSLYSVTTSADASVTTEPADMDQELSRILGFVDNLLLASPNTLDRDSILDRIRSEHETDFRTAEASCLDIEDAATSTTIGLSTPPLSFERVGCSPIPNSSNGDQIEAAQGTGMSHNNDYLSSISPLNSPTASSSPHDSYPFLAIRSTEPVLDASDVDTIRSAAEDVWSAESTHSEFSSRFTYQYSGNSEAHVFDFGADDDSAGAKAVSALNKALHTKIYPMIREAFFPDRRQSVTENEVNDETILFVYDALVIRYNATAAAEASYADASETETSEISAGQPLHRDLGLVSVNIMLNSDREFEGGGTFFENQLWNPDAERKEREEIDDPSLDTTPLKPLGVGYCLAHSASERHAGAGTKKGVRDILVLFVSAANLKTNTSKEHEIATKNTSVRAPAELSSLRLKSCRSFCNGNEMIYNKPQNPSPEQEGELDQLKMEIRRHQSVLLCRILHQRLAVCSTKESVSSSEIVGRSLLSTNANYIYDGEALQYLGTALMEYSDFWQAIIGDVGGVGDGDAACQNNTLNDTIDILKTASDCFLAASLMTPCDSRVFNNQGIVIGKIRGMIDADQQHSVLLRRYGEDEEERAYRKGLKILHGSLNAGCADIERHLESLLLNYGLFLSNLDRFEDAVDVLGRFAADATTAEVDTTNDTETVRSNAVRLWRYCKLRLAQ